MKRPNFFIIGAPKSGTTALAHYLSEHPQVFISQPKELFYWSADHPKARSRHNVHSIEDYLKYFKDCGDCQILGEGSTNYLQSRVAVESIMNFNPSSKFVVLLRDPVDVAYGMHGELMRHFFEDVADFEAAWDLQSQRASGQSIPHQCVMENQLQYQDVASFGSQLERLFELVPENQRRVFLFSQFKSDTESVYSETLRFLSVDEDGRKHFPRMNQARQYRSKLVGKLYQNPPAWIEPTMKKFRRLYAASPSWGKETLAKLLSRQKPRPELESAFRLKLRGEFRQEVEKLEQLLRTDLSSWK